MKRTVFNCETGEIVEITMTSEEVAALYPIDKIAELSSQRYAVEVGGVNYLGKKIQTDRQTRANWIAILIEAQSNPAYAVTWKTMDDSFAEYNAQQCIEAALTVSAHVQKCFVAEAQVSETINNYNTGDAIKTAFLAAYDTL